MLCFLVTHVGQRSVLRLSANDHDSNNSYCHLNLSQLILIAKLYSLLSAEYLLSRLDSLIRLPLWLGGFLACRFKVSIKLRYDDQNFAFVFT